MKTRLPLLAALLGATTSTQAQQLHAADFLPTKGVLDALSAYCDRPYQVPGSVARAYVPTPADLDRYVGTYGSFGVALETTFFRKGTTLMAQSTGQSAYPLVPVSRGVFRFEPGGIRVVFDAARPTLTLTQGGREFVFTKE